MKFQYSTTDWFVDITRMLWIAVITQPADQTSTIGSTIYLPIIASDNGFTVHYSATGLPAGLTINTSTGVISGTVTAVARTYTVTIKAANWFNQNVKTSFKWTIH